MIRIKDIPQNEINTILSKRDFTACFPATLNSIVGNRIGLDFKRQPNSVFNIPEGEWVNSQIRIRGDNLTGATMRVTKSEAFNNATDKNFFIEVNSGIYDLSKLQLPSVQAIPLLGGVFFNKQIPGSSIILEWNYSILPIEYFEKKYIIDTNMPANEYGYIGLDRGLTNTFVICDTNNHILPIGCSTVNADGRVGCNKHYKIDIEQEVREVDKTGKVFGDPINIDIFIELGLDPSPDAVSLTPTTKPITMIVYENKHTAEKNNLTTIEVPGRETIINDKYIEAVK